MSTLQTLVSTAESAKIDRIVLTIQPKGDGEANATVHFAVDQQASLGLSKESTALRCALSKAIMAYGSVEELEAQITDSLRRIESALGLGVEKYRAVNTADDVIKALMVASVTNPSMDEDAPENAQSLAATDDGNEPDTAIDTHGESGTADYANLDLEL